MSSTIAMKAATWMPGAPPAASPQVPDRRLLPLSLHSWGELCPQQGGVGLISRFSLAPRNPVPTGTFPTSPVRHLKYDSGISVWRPPL
jgi:hypothetical protein